MLGRQFKWGVFLKTQTNADWMRTSRGQSIHLHATELRYVRNKIRILGCEGDPPMQIGVENLAYMLEHPWYRFVPLSKG